jgi:hypothetical protein
MPEIQSFLGKMGLAPALEAGTVTHLLGGHLDQSLATSLGGYQSRRGRIQ